MGASMWTVQEAKAQLSQILQRAKHGEPQIIGTQNPCVVISMADFNELKKNANMAHPGQWLVENFPRGTEFELPSRADNRADPFA